VLGRKAGPHTEERILFLSIETKPRSAPLNFFVANYAYKGQNEASRSGILFYVARYR
jgi:hypothetical protein